VTQKNDQANSSKINNPEWANHFLDEWKYRHDAYARMTYRYIWSLVVLAVLPLIPLPAQLNPEFLQHVRQGTWYTLVYWLFVILVFVSTSVQLWREFHFLEEVRQKLQDVRGILSLSAEQQFDMRRRIRWVRRIYLSGFTAFFIFCVVIPWIHPGEIKQVEVITRMSNNEQFTVHFMTSFPPDCSLDKKLSLGVIMKYDRNTETWTATVDGHTTEWGLGPSSETTRAAFTPQKHLLIINGTGFWFDDDQRVYRSCGSTEQEVGTIEFSNQSVR